MDNLNLKDLVIEIPYKSHLASLVKGFAATFESVNNFKCESISNGEKEKLELEINFGSYIISYNFENENHDIIIEYNEIGESVGTYFTAEKLEKLIVRIEYNQENYTIKKKCIDSFIKDSKNYFNKKDEKEIVCKILKNGHWSVLSKLPKRSMDTIYLSDKQKKLIIDDLFKFKNSKMQYQDLGIPWKRNYLLEGPPGTGKSSLIFALASLFNMNIHMINLGPKVDDSAFMSAIANLPNNTILLLEDIDALFVERKANDSNKSMVSFSGILNVLDGMARKNGLVTFLTTNYKNRLDKALIRPSRVDLIIKFENANKEQILQMFNKFFPDKDNFEAFYKKIEHINFSICAIQKFFMHIRFNSTKPDEDLLNPKLLKEIVSEMENNENTPQNMYI